MEFQSLLNYLTSARLGTGQWGGSTVSFLAHYRTQIRRYDRLVPVQDRLSDLQKMTFLQSAVSLIPELRHVQTSADMDKEKNGRDTTWLEYVKYIKSACETYDKTYAKKQSSRCSLRRF